VINGSLDLIARTVRPELAPRIEACRESIARIAEILSRMNHLARLQLSQGWPADLPPMLDLKASSAPLNADGAAQSNPRRWHARAELVRAARSCFTRPDGCGDRPRHAGGNASAGYRGTQHPPRARASRPSRHRQSPAREDAQDPGSWPSADGGRRGWNHLSKTR